MRIVRGLRNLLSRARQEYSNEGIVRLLVNGTRFVTGTLWWEMIVKSRHLSSEELKQVARESGRVLYLEEEKPFRVDLPSHPKLRREFERYPTEFVPDTPFVCELENCHMVGQYGLVLTEQNRIVGETVPISLGHLCREPDEYYDAPKRLLFPEKTGLRAQPEPDLCLEYAFPMICSDTSYYHWMTEYLPKLRLLEHYVQETGHEPHLVVEPDPPGYVRETLELIGYPESEYLESEGNTIFVKNMVVPLHRHHRLNLRSPEDSRYDLSLDDLKWLRKKVRSGVDLERGENNRNLYVSRRKADCRRVVNYDETVDMLQDRGFETLVLEDMPFREQVKRFKEADVIMGPHGAGLLNMIFSDDPTVVEMFPDESLSPYFYFISAAMGFEYIPILTEARNDTSNSSGSWVITDDLIVDIDALRDHLDSIQD